MENLVEEFGNKVKKISYQVEHTKIWMIGDKRLASGNLLQHKPFKPDILALNSLL